MTEEEYFIKTYPDFCYGDRPLSPYWDLFQDGVEFGERQSEKRIAELEKEVEKHKWNDIFLEDCAGYDKKIAKEYTTLQERIEKLERENAELKEKLGDVQMQKAGEKSDLVWKLTTANEQKAVQLAQAKEIIRMVIDSYNHKERFSFEKDLIKAEQFLNSEVEK